MRLVIDNVSKLYRGKVWGLWDFSLTLEAGILGLVGALTAPASPP